MNREANCSDNYPLLRTPKVVVVCVYGGRSGGDSESKEFTILGVLQTSVYLKLLFLPYITLLGGWSSIPTPLSQYWDPVNGCKIYLWGWESIVWGRD